MLQIVVRTCQRLDFGTFFAISWPRMLFVLVFYLSLIIQMSLLAVSVKAYSFMRENIFLIQIISITGEKFNFQKSPDISVWGFWLLQPWIIPFLSCIWFRTERLCREITLAVIPNGSWHSFSFMSIEAEFHGSFIPTRLYVVVTVYCFLLINLIKVFYWSTTVILCDMVTLIGLFSALLNEAVMVFYCLWHMGSSGIFWLSNGLSLGLWSSLSLQKVQSILSWTHRGHFLLDWINCKCIMWVIQV